MRPPAERGFTLIEVMVALAVLGLAVLAILNLQGENLRTAQAMEARVLASVVADNQAIAALTSPEPPALGRAEGQEEAAGRAWTWRRTVARTAAGDVLRIDVRVGAATGARTLAEVTVFRGGAS